MSPFATHCDKIYKIIKSPVNSHVAHFFLTKFFPRESYLSRLVQTMGVKATQHPFPGNWTRRAGVTPPFGSDLVPPFGARPDTCAL